MVLVPIGHEMERVSEAPTAPTLMLSNLAPVPATVLIGPKPEDVPDPVKVSVTDHGPGIPEEQVPRLTERFYRVNVESSRSKKGTGLGLAIVKHILTRHRARLLIRSEIGKGSTFTVRF